MAILELSVWHFRWAVYRITSFQNHARGLYFLGSREAKCTRAKPWEIKWIFPICWDGTYYGCGCFWAGAEVAVLCITTSGEVLNYQAFTNSKGIYTVAETMPESDRWDACLARPISSFHEHCTHLGGSSSGVKFTYSRPSGYFHTVRPFVYQPTNVPTYCLWMVWSRAIYHYQYI